MAVRIYLDTQDYSRLAQPTGELLLIHDFLLKLVDEKKIEIGFSYPIVAELIQNYSPEFKTDRIKRAQCIKRFCGTNVFRTINRLRKEKPFSNDGNWLPEMGNILTLKQVTENFYEDIPKKFPQASRQHKNMLKNKRALPRLVKENPEAFYDKVTKDVFPFPVSPKFIEENMLIKYLEGKISRDVAEREMLKSIIDVEYLVETWFEYGQKGNFIYDNIHGYGDSLRRALVLVKDAIGKATELEKTTKDLERSIKESEFYHLFEQEINDLKKNINPIPEITSHWIKSFLDARQLNEFPDQYFDAVAIYIKAYVQGSYAPKVSDAVDLFHASYIPYCDLWRGDKGFSSILTAGDFPAKERIVPKLEELPARITKLLNG